jgi:hypothetical protein
MAMPMAAIISMAVVSFLAVNTVTLVLLGSTRARRESVALRPSASRRDVRIRTR